MSSPIPFSSLQTSHQAHAGTPEWLEIVRSKVDGLRYGVVQVVIHDGRVTQIDRTERTRLDSSTREA